MTNAIEEKRRIPVRGGFDLIVIGGGIAGIAASLAGSREGLKTMLIEKSVILGGLATQGLINWYEPLCDGEGKVMTTGIAEELLKLSIAYSYHNLHEQWTGQKELKETPQRRYATRFNPMVFALSLNDLVIRENVELRYDTIASYPMIENHVCTGIITESAGGREFFPAKVVIDATGDGDISFRAGVPCRKGSNYLTYWAHGCNPSSMEQALDTHDMGSLNAADFRIGSDLNGKGHPEGLHLFEGTTSEDRSEYVRLGQTLLLDKIKAMPKDKNCLYTLPGMIQFRKTRCIVGQETFTGEEGKHLKNSIGALGDFRKPGKHFELPLGIIFNQNFPNLLSAGRIVSADGDGWEIARVIPSAALTGQAAGIAASVMIKQEKPAADLRVRDIQELLKNRGVQIHF
jgi:ribulose 1,5-bisphosphate synthetase/thiazole synthase